MSTQLNPEAIIDGSITKAKLSEEVQTSLGKADTALQSYTEQYTGTITGIKMNGVSKGTSGVVDLGTVITAHQDISGKQDTLVSGTNIKTINGESILGEGDLTIEGGAKVYIWNWDGNENGTLTQEEYDGIKDADVVAVSASDGVYVLQKAVAEYTIQLMGITATPDGDNLNVIAHVFLIQIDPTQNAFAIFYHAHGESIIPTKTSQLENDSNFVSSDGLKTINGESIVGSGDIVISGDTSSGGAYAEVNHGTSDTTFALTPNTFHVWDEVTTLDLSFGEETSGVANEYLFQFTSGATATSLTVPDTVEWVDGTPTIEANKTYQVSIVNNIGLIVGV